MNSRLQLIQFEAIQQSHFSKTKLNRSVHLFLPPVTNVNLLMGPWSKFLALAQVSKRCHTQQKKKLTPDTLLVIIGSSSGSPLCFTTNPCVRHGHWKMLFSENGNQPLLACLRRSLKVSWLPLKDMWYTMSNTCNKFNKSWSPFIAHIRRKSIHSGNWLSWSALYFTVSNLYSQTLRLCYPNLLWTCLNFLWFRPFELFSDCWRTGGSHPIKRLKYLYILLFLYWLQAACWLLSLFHHVCYCTLYLSHCLIEKTI